MKTKTAIAGSLGSLVILVVSQLLAQLAANGLLLLHVPEAVCLIAMGALYFGAAYLLLRLFAEKAVKLSMEELGMPSFHISWKWAVTAVLLPLLVTGAYLLLPGSYVSSPMGTAQAVSTFCCGVFYSGLAAGFVEEMVFRGVILNLLDKRWNKTVAVLAPSALFGLVHILGMGFSVLSGLLVLAAGTLVGIMFSLIELEGRSVWNSGIVHALWNIVIIGGILQVGPASDETAIVTYVLKTDNFALTGGEFGIESSVISAAAYLLVSLLALFLLHRKKADLSPSDPA